MSASECANCDYVAIGLKPEGWLCGRCRPKGTTLSPDEEAKVSMLRGMMRNEITLGSRDYTRAVYLACRDARLHNVPDVLVQRAVADLREEGLIPTVGGSDR